MSQPSSVDTKGTNSTTDDIGVRFSGGSLVGYIAPDSTYAFDASGTAAIVGVSDLTLTGMLSAQKNTTGANVSKSITVAGVTRTLDGRRKRFTRRRKCHTDYPGCQPVR
ncbi:MAG UNVERIFIED_CONTAM: hypothetical protein LVR18_02885 [Planctomycetaceae bacterium]|jgi:hypothetical protein